MPCNDGGPTPEEHRASEEATLRREQEQCDRDSALCAVLSYLLKIGEYDSFMARLDWREAGITQQQLEAWWHRHRRQDAQRRGDTFD